MRLKTALLVILLTAIAWMLFYHFSKSGTSSSPPSAQRTLVALAKNVYYEAALAREPDAGLELVAYVTARRAQANRRSWGGRNVYDVVYARSKNAKGKTVCQFSWTCDYPKTDLAPTFDDADPTRAAWQKKQWEKSLQVARAQQKGEYAPPKEFEHVTYYLNIEVTTRRWRHNVCNFKTSLVHVGKIDPASKHDAFREPVGDEKARLPKRSEVPECKPAVSAKKKSTKT
jgi:hypothetical protein